MKKLLFVLIISLFTGVAVKAQDDKDKVKKTSSIPQHVLNKNPLRKHKRHNGYKTKHKHHGVVTKKTVNTKNGKVTKKVKPEDK